MHRGVFEEHHGGVTGIVNLFDDVLLSVDGNGGICTWKASSRSILEHFVDEIYRFRSMENLDDSRFLVGGNPGQLILFTHEKGRNINAKYLLRVQDPPTTLRTRIGKMALYKLSACAVIHSSRFLA